MTIAKLSETNLYASEVYREMERRAVKKGFFNPTDEELVRLASQQVTQEKAVNRPIKLAATGDLLHDIGLLAAGLRRKGFVSQAEEIEGRLLMYKKAETDVYNLKLESPDDLSGFAHRDGDVDIVDAGEIGEVETVQSAAEKILSVVRKQPTGKQPKLASLAASILKMAGEPVPDTDVGLKPIKEAVTPMKTEVAKIQLPPLLPFDEILANPAFVKVSQCATFVSNLKMLNEMQANAVGLDNLLALSKYYLKKDFTRTCNADLQGAAVPDVLYCDQGTAPAGTYKFNKDSPIKLGWYPTVIQNMYNSNVNFATWLLNLVSVGYKFGVANIDTARFESLKNEVLAKVNMLIYGSNDPQAPGNTAGSIHANFYIPLKALYTDLKTKTDSVITTVNALTPTSTIDQLKTAVDQIKPIPDLATKVRDKGGPDITEIVAKLPDTFKILYDKADKETLDLQGRRRVDGIMQAIGNALSKWKLAPNSSEKENAINGLKGLLEECKRMTPVNDAFRKDSKSYEKTFGNDDPETVIKNITEAADKANKPERPESANEANKNRGING